MSNIYDIRKRSASLEQCSEAAGDWIAKMDKGLSEAEMHALRAWLKADPMNESELLQMARMWDKMDILMRLSEVFPHSKQDHAPERTRWTYRFAMAASLVCALMVAFILNGSQFELSSELHADVATYETSIGGLSKIALSDGSEITLNTGSRVEVSYSNQQRVVKLERGEMHIDVAHDAARPLSVIAAGRVVQAIGTAFSVKIQTPERIEVVVDDGRVRIGMHEKYTVAFDHRESINILDDQSLVVIKGRRLILDEKVERLEVLEPEDMTAQLSWRSGNIIFRGESLATAVAEVGRYTPVEFVFLDPKLKQLRVAGLFKAGDVSGFLSTLEANFNILSERDDNEQIFLSSASVQGVDVLSE